jgi:hypothetical protein
MMRKKLIPVMKGEYTTQGKFFVNARPGSLDILLAPSRHGSKLFYPRDIYGNHSTKNQDNATGGKEAR